MKWRLYYSDGSIYNGESDEEAYSVPSVGIQLVKQECDNPRGYTLRHTANFYCWERIMRSTGEILDESRWGAKGDLFGLMNYYETQPGPQKVLVGIEIHDASYHDISRRAATDGCLCTNPCDHIGV